MDEQVVRPGNPAYELQRQFVCVRVVSMNDVDLLQFQFDFFQTWAVIFMNADGTVYGRYGTRAGPPRQATTHISAEGLRHAMERALALHAQYPANKRALAGKQPRPFPVRYAREFRWLRRRPNQQDPAKACIHCHMVGSSFVRYRWERGELTERDLFAFPLPDMLGLRMDRHDDLVVREIVPGTPAEEAGLQPGDRLVAAAGQPLVSQADLQWMLHQLDDGEELAVTFKRNGRRRETKLEIPHGQWRRGSLLWRELVWHLRPGMRLEAVGQRGRQRLGLKQHQMALEVVQIFRFDPRAREAGFRRGDVIIAVDGRQDLLTEESFLAHLWLTYRPNDEVPVTVLRDGQRHTLMLPMRWHPVTY